MAHRVTRNKALIFSIIAALGICNIPFGLMAQLVPLVMDGQGDSKFLIGANSMAGQAGVFVSGLCLTWLRQHFKSHDLVMSGLALALVCLGSFAFTDPLWWWFALRFMAGLGTSVIFTTGESWLQHLAGDQARGRVMGSYMSSQTITFAIGPFLIPVLGVSGMTPWVFGVAALFVGAILMSRVQVEEIAKAQRPASLRDTLARGRFLFLCIGVTTLFEGIMLTFFTLYVIHHGMELGNATRLLSVGIGFCFLFFFGIGWLGDHWSRRGTIFLCALTAVVGSLLQISALGTVWMWPLVVLIRAGAFGTYLGGFGLLGNTFRGTELVAASGLVSMLWGVGGIVGPPLAGLVFDARGIDWLPWFMAGCYVPVLLVLAATARRQPS